MGVLQPASIWERSRWGRLLAFEGPSECVWAVRPFNSAIDVTKKCGRDVAVGVLGRICSCLSSPLETRGFNRVSRIYRRKEDNHERI